MLSVRTHVHGLRTTYGSEFFDALHLSLSVHMYPAPICDIRHPICDSDFSSLGGKNSDETSDSDVRFYFLAAFFLLL